MNRQELERIEELVIGNGTTLQAAASVGLRELTRQIHELRSWAELEGEPWDTAEPCIVIARSIIDHSREVPHAVDQ